MTTTTELEVDPLFESILGTLKPEEDANLEALILVEGCTEPVDVWGSVIVDGHNRYRICQAHGIPFETRDHDFPDKRAALLWIFQKQSGRRNISGRRLKYLLGKTYSSKKPMPSKHSEDGVVTAAAMAEAHGVSEKTIKRYQEFARAIDNLPGALVGPYLGGVFRANPAQLEDLSRKLVNNDKRAELIEGLAAGEIDIEQIIGRAVSKKEQAIRKLGTSIKAAYRAADDAVGLTRNEEEKAKLEKAYNALEKLIKLLDLAPDASGEPEENGEA